MATYPRFFTLSDSQAVPQSGITPERATNGKLVVRQLWPDDKHDFDIGHVLTAAQKTELDNFYATNKALAVDFRWAPTGVTYSVLFVAPPRYTPRGRYFEARVRLSQI